MPNKIERKGKLCYLLVVEIYPLCIWVSLLLVSCMIEKLPPSPNWKRIGEGLDGEQEFVTSSQIDLLPAYSSPALLAPPEYFMSNLKLATHPKIRVWSWDKNWDLLEWRSNRIGQQNSKTPVHSFCLKQIYLEIVHS